MKAINGESLLSEFEFASDGEVSISRRFQDSPKTLSVDRSTSDRTHDYRRHSNTDSATLNGRRRRFQSSLWIVLLALLGAFALAEAGPATGPLTTLPPIKITPKVAIPKQQQQSSSSLSTPHPLYAFGNFGHVPERLTLMARIETKIIRFLDYIKERIQMRWERFLKELTLQKCFGWALYGFRCWVFWFFSKDCMASIYEDRWHAERDPDKFFGSQGMWITKGAHKDVVKRRIQRSRRNRQWVGLGYTPRLVWLVGVLLRGTFQCTAIPKVFNPSLTGWGAGTILGAKCTHQEWIATFMIGWFGSEHYWKYLFGCNGPPFAEPGFTGIPVFITKIRDVRL